MPTFVIVDDKELQARLGETISRLDHVEPLYANLGGILSRSMQYRFFSQTAPDGSPWAPLQPAYLSSDRKRGSRYPSDIMRLDGYLFGGLGKNVYPDRVEVGSGKIYAAQRQFGGTIRPRNGAALVFELGGYLVHAKQVTQPARPFVGASADDRERMLEAASDYFSGH